MFRPIPVFVACASAVICAESARAQTALQPPVPVSRQVSMTDGSVRGLVHDDLGRGIGGVSVIALGTTLGMAKSDATGRFNLALAPGDYVLRATREGYLSTYREPIRVQTSALIERNITLVRLGVTALTLPPALSDLLIPDKDADGNHTEAAWRLRHLTRSVLRDITVANDAGEMRRNVSSFTPSRSFVDAVGSPISGQFNFLTTSLLAASSGWIPTQVPRGIAYLSVTAPVGSSGDWRVRGATTAIDLSSWVALGEYQARPDRTHMFVVGLSYSAQLQPNTAATSFSSMKDGTRNVGGLYGFDRWRVRSNLDVTYGLRVDRYDYLNDTDLTSGRLGVRITLLPGTTLTASASQRMIAPGGDEFLPPPTEGVWIPPERTFSTLVPGSTMNAEQVRRYEVEMARAIGPSSLGASIAVRRFRENTNSQIATVFGTCKSVDDAGHYFVSTPGDIDLDGWTFHLSGHPVPRVSGTVEYSVTDAHRRLDNEAFTLARVVPSMLRQNRERLHDLMASVDATLPETSTHVSLVMRLNNGYSRIGRTSRVPMADGRFDFEVRQALPFEPVRGGRVEVMLAVRNLFKDLSEAASIYDELLTVAPPVRIMGGIQMKF